MKAFIFVNSAIHQKIHAAALRDGFAKHGITSTFGPRGVASQCFDHDIAVMWGAKPPAVVSAIKAKGISLLIAERGYLPDRFVFTSLGWDGLNHRARFPTVDDGGERFNKYWPGLLRSWKEGGDYVLLCGQVPGDAAVYGFDLNKWAQDAVNHLTGKGETVVFRPHPLVKRGQATIWPRHASKSQSDSLEQDLSRAKFCVTLNSNAGVESVYFGVPTYTLDEGAMAWDVSAHSLDEPPIRPDRSAWAMQLSWCNWTLEEIANGTAWDYLRQVQTKETVNA